MRHQLSYKQKAWMMRQPRARAATMSEARAMVVRLCLLALLTILALALSFTLARATEVQRVITPAGLEVWLVEDHTVPIIAMDFSFSGGTAQDADGKEGTVTMLTSLLDEGAADMDSKAFLTALEDNAIKFSFEAGRDRFYGSVRTLTPNKGLAFELLAKALQSPRFDEAPVERMRASWIAGAKRQQTDPNHLIGRAFSEAAFPNHPYSRPSRGTVETLTAITKEDIKAAHRAIMTRDGLTIGVVGAIDADSLASLIDAAFAPLPETGNLKPVKDVEITASGNFHIPFDAPQTSIRFGAPGIDRHDEDFFAAFLVNHILGGGSFTSRFYEEIREKRGLTYGVYSYLADFDHANMFGGGMSTRADNKIQAVELLKAEIARMAKDGPTQEELDQAKRFLIGNYPLRFDSSSKISRQLVGLQNDDLGIDYFDKRNSYIKAVTLEQAKRAAKRILDPSRLLMVTIGQVVETAQEAPQAANDNAANAKASGQ